MWCADANREFREFREVSVFFLNLLNLLKFLNAETLRSPKLPKDEVPTSEVAIEGGNSRSYDLCGCGPEAEVFYEQFHRDIVQRNGANNRE